MTQPLVALIRQPAAGRAQNDPLNGRVATGQRGRPHRFVVIAGIDNDNSLGPFALELDLSEAGSQGLWSVQGCNDDVIAHDEVQSQDDGSRAAISRL